MPSATEHPIIWSELLAGHAESRVAAALEGIDLPGGEKPDNRCYLNTAVRLAAGRLVGLYVVAVAPRRLLRGLIPLLAIAAWGWGLGSLLALE